MDMKVIEALLQTGNSYGQKRLLIHPLVESFLCLKWEALLPFFYTMLLLYGLFVMSLTLFIISVYFYRDAHNNTTDSNDSAPYIYGLANENRSEWLNYNVWQYVLYFTISLIVLQEILYMKVVSRRYFMQLETWVKFSSIVMAIILPSVIASFPQEWPRHLATVALLLSWLEMTFLLSRFPNWGYYVLMFRKVSTKVVKILLTFVFLVIGFALSFMIEYRSQIPFENPWSALVKTMVMMTSEFDYDDLVDKKHASNFQTSLVLIRLLFLIFLILAAIVLMNLMVAVAVNDLNDLEVLGNILRLEKQVEFLASLETLVNVKWFMKLLPKNMNINLIFARNLSKITLRPCEPSWSYANAIPAHVKHAIFDKTTSQKERIDEKVDGNHLQKKIDAIFNAVVGKNRLEFSDTKTGQSNDLISKSDLEVMKMQIDTMNSKLDNVMHYLSSSKLNNY